MEKGKVSRKRWCSPMRFFVIIALIFLSLAIFFKTVSIHEIVHGPDGVMPDWAFNLMSKLLITFDYFKDDPAEVLDNFEIENGMKVIDFGCGPGRMLKKASQLVGSDGSVYAIDNHPLAKGYVEQIIASDGLKNVRFVCCDDYSVDIPDDSIDVVYTINVVHHVKEPERFFKEIHRVLKPSGTFFVSDEFKKHKISTLKDLENVKELWEIMTEDPLEDEYVYLKPK